jgi:hypothetical protein
LKPGSNCGKFCALPWVHRFTNIGGEIQVCCTSEETDNNIYDEAGRRMNIRDGLSDERIMNSSYMKNLRRRLLNGEWPEICRRCEITEDTGGISRRQDENRHFENLIPQLIESTQEDGTIPVDVKSADYRLGNLCNLACRMCSPRSSTPWLKFSVKLAESGIAPFSEEQWKEFSSYDWHQSPAFLEQVRAQLPTLTHLHFAGGEPLINPQMARLLRQAVDSGFSKNIRLTYNTNLTRVPAEIKELWPHFQSVHLYVSIDAFGPLNDFIRFPARWSEVDANLRDLDRNFSKYGLEYVAIMTTAQIYNIFHLEALYDYLFENMKHVMQLPKLIDLYVPTPLRTQVLPERLKSLARSRLVRILIKSEERLRAGLIRPEEAGTLDSLRGSIAFLELENREDELAQFWAYTEELDRLHKKNTVDFIPELSAARPERLNLRTELAAESPNA